MKLLQLRIQKEIASNIFEAFTVGDESRNSRQGSGLGLAIAKTIVELHEGTIELVLAPPKELSTEFKITLKKGPKLQIFPMFFSYALFYTIKIKI